MDYHLLYIAPKDEILIDGKKDSITVTIRNMPTCVF